MRCFGQDHSHPVLEGRTLVLGGTQQPPQPPQVSAGCNTRGSFPCLGPSAVHRECRRSLLLPQTWAGTGSPSAACSALPVASPHLCFHSAPPCATAGVDKLCQKPSASPPFLFSVTGGNCPCARQCHGFSSPFPTQAVCWKALRRHR